MVGNGPSDQPQWDIFDDPVASVEQAVEASQLESQLLHSYIEEQPEFFDHARPAGDGLWLATAADGLALGIAMSVAAAAEAAAHPAGAPASVAVSTLVRLLLCLPLYLAVLTGSRHLLRRRLYVTQLQQARELVLPLATTTLACIAGWRILAEIAPLPARPEDGLLLTCVVAALVVPIVRRVVATPVRGGRHVRRVLIVGSGAVAERVHARVASHPGVRVVGFVDNEPKDASGCLGCLNELSKVCERYGVHHVVVAFTRASTEEMIDALRDVQGRISISVVPRLFDVLPASAAIHDLASGYPAMSVSPAAFGRWSTTVKRALDLIGALVGIIVTLPVLVIAALGVRVTSPGPVFLRHRRIGRNGREFTVWKFRTFTVTESVPPPDVLAAGEQVVGPFPKLKNDPRATPFGRWLRRLSIDELPQLWNVLSGSMSLVGPRPLAPEFAWQFGTWALRRYAVKPGLTGLWQVSGRNDLTYEEMCRLDHLYVACWSVGLDVQILARTGRAVLSGRGCY